MDSLYEPTLEASFDDPSIQKSEPSSLKLIRIVNLIALCLFAVTWSLNFIWCGWAGAYTAIMVFSLVLGICNGLFVVGKHHQRMRPFKTLKSSLLIILGIEILALLLSITFLVIGCIGVSGYNGSAIWISPGDKQWYMISKFQIAFSIIFGIYSVTFAAYLKRFLEHHLNRVVEKLSESEEKRREESQEEEEERINTLTKYQV